MMTMPNFGVWELELIIVLALVVTSYYLLGLSIVWAAKRFKRWWKEND